MAANGVLSGLRLVEAAAFVAAPLGGMTLAQMGADVIRIDTLQGGLDHRRWPVTSDNTSLFWTGLNKAKRSVALDLASPEGKEIAVALITAPGKDAGLFVTNFPPRGWLDYSMLSAKRPDLIQLTLQGDRHGGAAVDYTVNPRLGVPAMTGPLGADPVNHVLPAWDLITGHMLAVGLLAAERHRGRTGHGQHVKLSLQDVGLAVMAHLGFIEEARRGQPRARHGNELFGAFGRDFTSIDGERVMLVGLTGKQWRSIVEATGLGVALDTEAKRIGLNFALEGDRFQGRREIGALVGAWVGSRTLLEVSKTFDAHGVCWTRYQSIDELANSDPECSPQNPMFAMIEQPGVGSVLAPGIPLDFIGSGRLSPQPAPVLGQHTEEVLSELLGMGASEFGKLHDRGIVASRSDNA